MNVTQLKYLRAVISEGSFAKAAQALYVSPQAISKAIKALEEELRFPLFTREGRGIAPTDVAVRFSKQAEDAVRSFDDLAIYASGCQEADEACDIRLGVVEAAGRFIRKGGIVLVARENRFAAPPADMASLPFDADERFTVPLNLVHRSDRSRAIARLYAFIATMARQNFAQARESA